MIQGAFNKHFGGEQNANKTQKQVQYNRVKADPKQIKKLLVLVKLGFFMRIVVKP